jgi:hypothetical protein
MSERGHGSSSSLADGLAPNLVFQTDRLRAISRLSSSRSRGGSTGGAPRSGGGLALKTLGEPARVRAGVLIVAVRLVLRARTAPSGPGIAGGSWLSSV